MCVIVFVYMYSMCSCTPAAYVDVFVSIGRVCAVCLFRTSYDVRGDKCAVGAALSSCLWTHNSTLIHRLYIHSAV